MNRYTKIVFCLIFILPVFFLFGKAKGQCFTNYSLSPNGYQCGTSVNLTMSGSQSGVSYQLKAGSVNVGGVKIGTGSAMNIGTATADKQGDYIVVALANSTCTQQVVANTAIYFNPSPAATVTASSTIVCASGPVTFTAQPNIPGTYNYQWFKNGPPVSGATSQTFTTATAGNYTVLITNSCGSTMVTCPSLTSGVTPGAPGNVTGPVSIAQPFAASVYKVTPSSNAIGYEWSISNPAAGVIMGKGTTAVMKWNTAFFGNVVINVNALGSCGSTPATGLPVTLSAPITSVSANCAALNLSISTNRAYILTTTSRVPLTALSDLSSPSTCDMMKTVEYYDGLGRPVQLIQVNGSPTFNDLVQPIKYDLVGRESISFLPYTSTINDGSYKADALNPGVGQESFYATPPATSGVTVIDKPYAIIGFEASPVSRIVEQGASGSIWQLSGSGSSTSSGHTLRTDYTANDQTSAFNSAYNPGTPNPGSRVVALYKATTSNVDQSQTLTRQNNNATYPSGKLMVTILRDENWQPADGCIGTTETYKDFEGNVVLKRTYNLKTGSPSTVEMLSTYYVYDNYHNLVFVLTPGSDADANTAISQTTLDNVCYQYQYDTRNRLSRKRLPGSDWQYFVYNLADRPVATQDGNQRLKNQWTFTKYDVQGRAIMTGIWDNGNTAISPIQLQSNINNIATLFETKTSSGYGYTTSSAWPQSAIITTLSVNYYDNYNGIPNLPATFTPSDDAMSVNTGMVTASLINVLGKPDMLWKVGYYDMLGRETLTYKQNYFGGVVNVNNYDKVSTTYNFTNQPTTTTKEHHNTTSGSTLFTISNRFIYDHLGRKQKNWQQIKNGSGAADTRILISQLKYNEVGQLWTKGLHSMDSVSFAQIINFKYNERGWLLQGSSPLFNEQLQYNVVNTIAGIVPQAQYNGNIASQSWTTNTDPIKSYTYAYDRLNRLTSGVSTAGNSEQGIAYDKLGNITALQRSGVIVDNLIYSYKNGGISNQINTITDNSGGTTGMPVGTSTYNTYDANGNSTVDGKNASAVTFNLLNLPETYPSKGVTYVYDAAGLKLRRIIGSTATDYLGDVQYSAGALLFIQTENGRALPNGPTAYNYEYNIPDHLGNTRVTFDTPGNTARVVQKDDYYPFGLNVKNSTTLFPENKYLYNGKELQDDLGQYDYGARFYDPVIARWTTVDPLAEKDRRWSPYNYVRNNPMRFTDPDGMRWIEGTDGKPVSYTQNKDGSVTWSKNASADTKEYGNALISVGSKASLDKVINNDIKTHIVVTSAAKEEATPDGLTNVTYGETIQGNNNQSDNYGRVVNSDGTFGIKEATITIYKGSIDDVREPGTGSKLEGLTQQQAIGAVATHENVHGSNKSEINKDLKYEMSHGNQPRPDKETLPNAAEQKVIDAQKKKNTTQQ